MIDITVNGSALTLAPGAAVSDAVAELTGRTIDAEGKPSDGGEPLGIAVAVDGVVVPRTEWSARALEAGSRVEVITAAQGG
ncbi:sulfur carrier protein ThiS [Microbacterium amylolyticum]|uniref:Sulfur carrier protein n=1 Tax=Microbacterium amylolyticum TaxID=936337 RepID=A0ABS4ZH55_9MICO|nr:sulfur carrier protein ThiS [Microbacterium amylolyticum]MBP2436320.1 sulfur carrier protein [Microbacterium amylolyticum]